VFQNRYDERLADNFVFRIFHPFSLIQRLLLLQLYIAVYNIMRLLLSIAFFGCYLASKATALVPSARPETTRSLIGIGMEAVPSSRRTFVSTSLTSAIALAITSVVPSQAAVAATTSSSSEASSIPMITTDEFLIVLRDSSRSIARVDIYNDARVTVRLLDGTSFGIKDVVESSTDPRSSLKIAAVCRENKVPFQYVDLQSALTAATTKRKNYANSRVQEAAVREQERLARMQQDEDQRLAVLQKMKQDGR
jgi:hypothetical protein